MVRIRRRFVWLKCTSGFANDNIQQQKWSCPCVYCTVYSSSDEAANGRNKRTNLQSTKYDSSKAAWSFDLGNSVTFLRYVDDISGMNSCTHYIGGVLMSFLCHVGDENLFSISFLCSEAPKFWWHIVTSSSKAKFDAPVGNTAIDLMFFSNHHGGVEQIVASENSFSIHWCSRAHPQL